MTALISSHNLRELEDLCDHVAILHKGQLLMTREMDNLRTSYCKVQTAFRPAVETLDLPGLSVLRTERVGRPCWYGAARRRYSRHCNR